MNASDIDNKTPKEELKKNKGDGLRNKAAKGIAWTAIQKYSTMFISFVSGIILARLLTPYDYGCIGMLAIFMTLSESFIDCGFGAALIQKKNPTQEDYSTVFYFNIGISLLIYAVLFFVAPAIASFYNVPLLSKVLRVQGVVLIIYALNIIQSNQLRKNLNFKLLAIIGLSTTIISLIVTIIMAYSGFGVWALVVQNILVAAIPCVVYWFFVKWRPAKVFSLKSFNELFSFGIFLFLSTLINKFSQQVQGLLIGKLYTPATMGYYSKAHSTEQLASHSVSQVMVQVTYPLFSKVQDDKQALGNMIKRMTMTIAYITMPLLTLLMLIAKPLFLLLYSERWLPCVPYFQILCLAGMANCLLSSNLQAITAIGLSKTHFVWTIIRRGVGILFIVGGMFLCGMKGLLAGAVLNECFSYMVNVFLVSKYIGYKWWNQLLNILPVMVVVVISALASILVSYAMHLPIYIDALLKIVAFITVYMGWSLLFKPESYMYIRLIINPFVEKFRKITHKY